MTAQKILLLSVFAIFVAACSPAKIVLIPRPAVSEKAQVVVFRETTFNANAVRMVFGANSMDFVELGDGNYAEIDIRSGQYEFYVRSSQIDKPYILPLSLMPGARVCLKAYANPANLGKAFMPIVYYVSNTFILAEVRCPTEKQLFKYSRVAVRYDES